METTHRSARQIYIDGLHERRLLFQFDQDTGTAVFYPREVGPGGRPQSLVWHESKGLGTLYSYTEITGRNGTSNIVLVDLDEGFRMMSTVTKMQSSGLAIGMRVHARFDLDGDEPRVTFEVHQ